MVARPVQSAMWVEGSCGPHYLLSSYSGHLALPGGSRVFHRDQWWMPVPIIRGQNTSLRAGVSGSPPRWLSRRRRTGSADPWAAALLSRSVPLDVLALALLIDLWRGVSLPPASIRRC